MAAVRVKMTSRTSSSLALNFPRDDGNSLSDLFSRYFFAEPRFRASSPDLKHISDIGEDFSLEMPGVSLAAAAEYYCIEAYATKADRDRACGLAGSPDVKYVSIQAKEIPHREMSRIACGYALDHPRFEDVFVPIFGITLRTLANEISRHRADANYAPAETAIAVGRVHYTITALPDAKKFKFKVDGLCLFEKRHQSILDRTAKFLEDRLVLETSQLLILH